MYSAIKMIYGYDLVEKDGKLTLYRRTLGTLKDFGLRSGIEYQFLMTVFVLAASAVAFWSDFLLDEKDSCDDQFDCFAFDGGAFVSSNLVQSNPLENCTEFENGSHNIRCLRFSFDYANALGNAGGVLIISKVFASIIISLWIAVTTPMEENARKIFTKIALAVYFIAGFRRVLSNFWDLI